ncbi:MAG: hypothetical protein EA382_05895 [Spirochaetaceae bacterium]|nr:MAG: hypothetical protein EA382_05895 [Spirochaetaceae bacterium]
MRRLNRRDRKERTSGENRSSELPRDSKLTAEIDDIANIGDRRKLQRADTEVKEVVSKATQTDIRNIMLIDQGRCPVCASRTENFLFTMVCPSCGWFRREIPNRGSAIVHLTDGTPIECDYVHHGQRDEFLAIRDGVVISELMRPEVKRIDYVWADGELDEARALVRRLKSGVCSWCQTDLTDTPDDEHREDYVAFGTMQERYIFCTEKCQRAFRRHYPARVHRNCYEVDCNQCNLCVKRYDTQGFKRNILT